MIGRSDAAFPSTRHSVLRAVASPDPEVRRAALEDLAAVYWRPVYARYRLKWRPAGGRRRGPDPGFLRSRAMSDGLVPGL